MFGCAEMETRGCLGHAANLGSGGGGDGGGGGG